MLFKQYIKFSFFALSALFALPMSSQDMVSMQAPIDKHHKQVDTLSMNRVKKKTFVENPSGDLYTTWNTSSVHCYGNEQLPSTYRIDLRDYTMPTPSRKINSKYGYRPAFRRMHKGLDIKVYTGDTIRAAFAGKVRIVDYEGKGYGKYVVIRHNNGLETIYGHMSKHLVKVNDYVDSGQPIGLGGSTGMSTGSHLHFETRLLGEAINPALLFDFENQVTTGDYYVYHSKARPKPATIVSEKENAEETAEQKEAAAPPKQTASRSSHYHKVKKGETLYSIAKKLKIPLNTLCKSNHLTPKSRIRPGQILKY